MSKKKIIRLTENDLYEIISESVNMTLIQEETNEGLSNRMKGALASAALACGLGSCSKTPPTYNHNSDDYGVRYEVGTPSKEDTVYSDEPSIYDCDSINFETNETQNQDSINGEKIAYDKYGNDYRVDEMVLVSNYYGMIIDVIDDKTVEVELYDSMGNAKGIKKCNVNDLEPYCH